MQRLPMPRVIIVMAVSAGVAGANIHYSQPLLPAIGHSFGRDASEVATIPALTQAGFAIGIACLLPLADMCDRRQLVTILLGIVSASLLAQAVAPSFAIMSLFAFLLGLSCVVPQILPPFAAMLAPEGRENEAVGIVLSGILAGVLVSRVISGLLGGLLGWRGVYATATFAAISLLMVLRRALPRVAPVAQMPYPNVLRATLRLAIEEPRLRLHALAGGLTFAAFMAFWSRYAVELKTAFGMGSAQAGLFGAVGLAGSAAAFFAGRQIERFGFRNICLIAALLMAVSFGLLAIGRHSLSLTVLAVLVLDGAAGMSHVANQASAFSLRPEVRGRVNSVYMTGYFAGGSLGTSAASVAAEWYGWAGVCTVGSLASLSLLVTALIGGHQNERAAAVP